MWQIAPTPKRADAKASGDAAAFKRWLRQISRHVAEAATAGGFLGIGGVPVSEAEKTTLTDISNALTLTAPPTLKERAMALMPVVDGAISS